MAGQVTVSLVLYFVTIFVDKKMEFPGLGENCGVSTCNRLGELLNFITFNFKIQ